MKNITGLQVERSLEEMLNDCSIDAIIAIDTDKNIIAWNVTAERIYGKTKEEVIGKAITEVISSMAEDAETLKAIKLAIKGIKSFIPASKKYFHRLHAENHFITLQDETGIKGVMNLVHDVAHRIKAEEQLQSLNDELKTRYRQLQITSEELAAFTLITSNKIKEPIRQVYTGIEHLIKIEASRLTDGGKASFRRMQSSINRMDLLLDDVLTLAQISILDKPVENVNIKDIIDEVVKALANRITEKNALLTTGELGTIKAHRNQVFLLLYHLTDNAIKFNNSNAPLIHIGCKKVLEENLLNEISSAAYYKLSVTDNGIGFNGNDLETMFRMFEKLHGKDYKGSGIGLAIARKIMQAHGGFITAESNDAGGSVFNCYFPV